MDIEKNVSLMKELNIQEAVCTLLKMLNLTHVLLSETLYYSSPRPFRVVLLPLITLTLAVWNAVLLFHVHLLKVENVSVLTLNLTLTLTRVTFNTPDEHDFVTSPLGKSIPIQYATCTSVIWKRENSTTFPESGQLKPFK